MSTPSIYESLRSLPIFNGVSFSCLQQVIGEVPLDFGKYAPGERIIGAGDENNRLCFIVSGSVRATITNRTGKMRVSYTLTGPSVVAPDFVFGRNTSAPVTIEATDNVSVLKVAKEDIVRLLQTDEVFLYNYLNTLSTYAQKAIDGVLAITSGSLEERIAFWIIALTPIDAADIVLSARHRDLYTFFGVQRSSFMSTLDAMTERGLITYDQAGIRVTDRRQLRKLLIQ